MHFMYGLLSKKCQIKYPSKKFRISKAYTEKYKEAIEPAKLSNIWSFNEIGMFDPFPSEAMEKDFNIPEKDDDLVYSNDRYIKDNSPVCIYLPSKLLLLKIMRACIDIEHEKDLWFQINQ